MTYKEWIERNKPNFINKNSDGGVEGRPYDYGLETEAESNRNCAANCGKGCEYCWNRKMPKKRETMKKEFTKADLKPGAHFNFKGFEWVVLDNNVNGGVMAIMASVWNDKRYCFDEDGCNNYAKSSLRRKIINELLPIIGEDNLIPHEVDLVADNGDDRYGTVTDRVFILSCDEYRKYRKHVPLLPEWMWTCTPWYISDSEHGSSSVCFVSTWGYLNFNNANGNSGVAPACVFKKDIIVEEVSKDD